MLHTLLYCLIFIITLLILVIVHEWGHFWVARRLGVKTLCFSFGFGKPLWRYVGKDGTEYLFSLLPLGGYVKLLDGREMPLTVAEKSQAFDNQPLWVRMAILLAGPLMNLCLGWIAFSLVFIIGIQQMVPIIGQVVPYSIAAQAQLPEGATIQQVDGQPVDSWQKIAMALVARLGDSDQLSLTISQPNSSTTQRIELPLYNWSVNQLQPDPLKSLGIIPYHPPLPALIDSLEADSAAAFAGLRPADKIIAVNGRIIRDGLDLVNYVKTLPQQTVAVLVERAGKRFSVNLTVGKQLVGLHWRGKMGIGMKPMQWSAATRPLRQLSPVTAMQQAASQVLMVVKFHGVILKKLLTGKISLLSMGGPIAIFQTANFAFRQGIAVYMSFLGLMSVMLACVNLLPIPGLDGGQLLFCTIEGIIRRPIALQWQQRCLRLGAIFLILLMVQATLNDIIRLFS